MPHGNTSRKDRRVAEELGAPAGEQAAPTADTPQTPPTDTAANTPEAPQQIDYEARYKEAQAWATREAQQRRALEDRLLAVQAQIQQRAQDTSPPDDETPRERQLREKLEAIEAERQQAEWERVAQAYGEGIVGAYTAFSRGLQLDPSPQGALNAYVESVRLLAGPPEAPVAHKPPKPPATAADDNQPAATTSPAELERIKSEAVAKKNPGIWLEALLRNKWGAR